MTKENQTILNNLLGKEVKESSGYQECVVNIDELEIVEGGDTDIDHPLLNSLSADEQLFAVAHLTVKVGGEKIKHIEVGNLLTKNKDFAIYPTSTLKDGKKIVGTLLYDLIHGVKEYSSEQASLFEKGWKFSTDLFKNKKFESHAKVIIVKGERKVILLTSYQQVKDEEYKNEKEPEDELYKSSVKSVDIDAELPF